MTSTLDFLSKLDQTSLRGFENGNTLDDTTEPVENRFIPRVSKFIGEHEGDVEYVYDDSKAGAPKWKQGVSKGNPTIGVGFNLDRPDADKLLKKIGTSKRELMAGGVITKAQSQKLLELGMKESLGFLRKKFEGQGLNQHQWMALASLAYNSRWNDDGPTLIGPGITKAIMEKNWEAAAHEIRNRSNPTKNKGLQVRREAEARMFEGQFTRTTD